MVAPRVRPSAEPSRNASASLPTRCSPTAGSGRPPITTIGLNAFAKGWIVDLAIDAGGASGSCNGLVVSAGGDLRHCGDRPIQVAIENPLRPYPNEPPITTIALDNAALASSGRARRGFRIGADWYAHVLDPRTGDTVDGVASISVVADDAATADVLATIAGVLPPDDAVAAAAEAGSACLVATPEGELVANDRWRTLEFP